MRIFINEIVKGTHYWNKAEAPVKFLSNEHAHDFNIYIECDVYHDDRDLEFYILRNKILEIFKEEFEYNGLMFVFGNASCETIAKTIYKQLELAYGKRDWLIKISEEGIQGAIYNGY